MVFSSVIFILYFLPVFFLFYYLADPRYKNTIILLGSILFYAWGAPQFIFVILGTTLVDFYVVRKMYASENRRVSKVLLGLSVSLNLGLLFYFKYSNFFIENVNFLLYHNNVKPVAWTKLVLPIGISFYTFETLTYVVDVYKRVHKPLQRFGDYLLYIILFPKLIAGPIIRYHDFAGQIYDHTKHETAENRLTGMYRFFIGLGKKVFIANVMGAAADEIFALPDNLLTTTTAWMGALSYTFQIYFDFSGYSDMAIGLGKMMGFRFPENFDNPYTARSITDFWRRWHITLGTWMRNYLYIPLGGNKVNSQWRLYLNLLIVFIASGLWHGAAWGFVIWGAYHGFFLIAERLVLGRWLARAGKLACLYTFPVVLIGWVFFRLEHLTPSLHFLKHMFSWSAENYQWMADTEYKTILVLAFVFSFFTLLPKGAQLHHKVFYETYPMSRHYLMGLGVVIIFILSVSRITLSTFNPFIYFRF